MKTIYVSNLVKSFLKKKKMILICWIIIVLIFGGLGYLKAYPEKLSSVVAEENEEYEEAVQTYEEAIATTEENITALQEQLDAQQKYCDESIYMQIDPSSVKVASVQYVVSIADVESETASNTVSSILTAWTSYISGGKLVSELAEDFSDQSAEYLAELVSTSISGSNLTVSVKHYDMEQAEAMIQKIEGHIEDYKSTVEAVFGAFDMAVMDVSTKTVADISLQNTQNTSTNNLRTYKNTLVDHQTKVITLQTAKSDYIDQYKPDTVTADSPKKTIVEYAGLGVIAGIVLPFVVYALGYTMSGRIKGKEELLAADLNVLSVCRPKKGGALSFARAALDVDLLARQNEKETIGVCVLGDSAVLKQMKEAFAAALEERKRKVLQVQAGGESAEELEALTEAGNMVLMVESGVTTYAQLEEQMQFCKRFHISVWGCVVAE